MKLQQTCLVVFCPSPMVAPVFHRFQSNWLIYYDGSGFYSNGSLYIDDQHDIGFFDSNNLTSLERQFSYPLVIGSLTNDVIVLFQRTTGDEIKVPLESPYGSLKCHWILMVDYHFENSSTIFFYALEQFDIII